MSLTLRSVYTGLVTSAGGPGAKTLTGALAGDIVVNIRSVAAESTFYQSLDGLFERLISVNDQIQQTATEDLAANDPLTITLLR